MEQAWRSELGLPASLRGETAALSRRNALDEAETILDCARRSSSTFVSRYTGMTSSSAEGLDCSLIASASINLSN